MPDYYDLVLGAIPLVLLGVSGTLHVSGVELTTAVPLAGLLAVGLMGHAMFVNAPGVPSRPQSGTRASTASDPGPAVRAAD